MRGLNLTKNTPMRSNGYFNMIGDNLIVPTKNTDLQEPYFNERVKVFKGSPALKAKVKEYLKDSGSGVYFDPSWNKRLALDELGEVIAKSAFNKEGTGLAWDNLANAKRFRSDAISNMKGNWALISRDRLESQVNDSIKNATFPTKNDFTFKGKTRENINASINAINEWVTYQTIGDAYFNEIQRRIDIQKEVDRELLKGDLKKLKALRSTIKFEDLIDKIDAEIKTIEQAQKDAANRTEEERKAKALADAEAKALADAIKKAEDALKNATTPEAIKAAEAELQRLKNSGSNGAGTGLPKMAIYGGIALVVAIGAYFMFRKKD
jgi:hypothetical protein